MDWNASSYHRVSNPQFEWGVAVLDRLVLRGDECVLDVGCGTGRLTALLADRVPQGRVIGVDKSPSMLATAAESLPGVPFILADASALPLHAAVDVIFSTATFHWVIDHPRLFRSLYEALGPGGRLLAQCGGGANIQRLRDRAAVLMKDPLFAPHFRQWPTPWNYANAEITAVRLQEAGFVDVKTGLEHTPVVFDEPSAFGEFLTTVICRPYLAQLPSEEMRVDFVAQLTSLAAQDDPPFELDYWRLNLQGRKAW
jgi:trans-aconitate methyltransferase